MTCAGGDYFCMDNKCACHDHNNGSEYYKNYHMEIYLNTGIKANDT